MVMTHDIRLSGGGSRSTSLGEVRAHVTLEVEVSKHVTLANLEKSG